MAATGPRVRPATPADLPAVMAIYDEQVLHATSTFELVPPGRGPWEARLASTEPGDHVLVAELAGADAGAASGVLGYAYSTAYRGRPAYRHTRETSVYVDPAAQGRGVGRSLYDELVARLRADGMHTAVAAIALPNPASVALHLACGFERVGVMREVGRKMGRWIDVEWWQVELAGGPA